MAPPVQSDVDATSPESSDTENNVMLNINTSRADLLKVNTSWFTAWCDACLIMWLCLEIARQYQAEKNTARAELKILNRKLADITNDDDDSSHRPKRRKTRQISPPAGSDEEDTTDTSNRANEHFVYQAGHKFFLIYAPWLRSGDDLFDIDVNMRYNSAERFENDKNKSQGQLQEIINLLQAKFQSQALRQKWLRRQVSFFCMFRMVLYSWITWY